MPKTIAIQIKVIAAFFDFGSRNAGTPLLTASTPVNAEQPVANARSNTATPTTPTAAEPA